MKDRDRKPKFLGCCAVASSLAAIGILLANSCAASGEETFRSTPSLEWKHVPQDGIIKMPGRYRLHQNMQVDRSTGIKVQADNVTIDLCGHALRFAGTPRKGTFGIVVSDQTGVTISNGVVGGFWFNVHCTQNENLRIGDMKFDDIPYLAINVAQSRDVAICDNEFTNFRYDVPKDAKSTYVIGINIGAEGAVICNNRFAAEPEKGTAQDVEVETVFVLFSANVSKKCLVGQNEMMASEVLPRSYGVWVATNAQATVVNNSIRNMKFGVCLATDASALVCFNRFEVATGGDVAIESYGIKALRAKDIGEIKNSFDGVSIPVTLPESKKPRGVGGG